MLTLCIPDIHIPDHDPDALSWALRTGLALRPYKVILLGDVINFDPICRFPKPPRAALTLQDELEAAQHVIRRIDQTFKAAKIVWLCGNHEERLTKYLWRNAPELADLQELALEHVLRVPVRWKVVPPMKMYREQGVFVFHGVRWSRTVLDYNLREYGVSSVQGHSHRLDVKHHRLANGRIISAAEAGTLQKLHVNYCLSTDWCHGMAVIESGAIRILRKE